MESVAPSGYVPEALFCLDGTTLALSEEIMNQRCHTLRHDACVYRLCVRLCAGIDVFRVSLEPAGLRRGAGPSRAHTNPRH